MILRIRDVLPASALPNVFREPAITHDLWSTKRYSVGGRNACCAGRGDSLRNTPHASYIFIMSVALGWIKAISDEMIVKKQMAMVMKTATAV